MKRELWGSTHPTYGAPFAIAGRYLGSLTGQRTWHGFEVWIEDREGGVIFMSHEDLAQLTVTDLE